MTAKTISLLIKCGQSLVDLFDKDFKKGDIKPVHTDYIFDVKVKEMKFEGMQRSLSYEKPIKRKPIYLLAEFTEKNREKIDSIIELEDLIIKHYKKLFSKEMSTKQKKNQVKAWLNAFFSSLYNAYIEKVLTEELILENAYIFLNEIDQKPAEFHVLHKINGLGLQVKKIKINDNLLLRQPLKKDFEYEQSISMPGNHYGSILANSILEIDYITNNEFEIYDLTNLVSQIISLFKFVSFNIVASLRKRKSVIILGSTSYSTNPKHISGRYNEILENEIEQFIDFFNTFEKIFNFEKENDSFRPMQIALERYNWSLRLDAQLDRKLLSCVMGLEPLFSLENERGEHSYKLRLRIAKFLSFFGFNTTEVEQNIRCAYDFRNSVVHGRKYGNGWQKEISVILPHVQNYLRLALIVFMLNLKTSKDKIIELIDHSLIDTESNETLRNLLEKDKERFKASLSNIK